MQAMDMPRQILEGTPYPLRAVFALGMNARMFPNSGRMFKALESLDFFVIQELFMTETAQYADVILPGVSYAEKEGTFTNTERRVQRVRKAVTIPGTPDWIRILSLI